MTAFLERLGRTAYRRRRIVLVAWLVTAVAIVAANRGAGGTAVDDMSVPGVESQTSVDLLEERFPTKAGATAQIVFHVDGGAVTGDAAAAAIGETVDRARAMAHVVGVTDPLADQMSISNDGSTAVAVVQFDGDPADLGYGVLHDLEDTGDAAAAAGVQVEYGGELPTVLEERETGKSELIGILAAVLILLAAFGSVVAMGLPIATAIFGLATGLSLVGALSAFVNVPTVASRLGTMIGLGVGIDYALFVVSRHRQHLDDGMDLEESVARTNATAGQAVVFAGGTVVIAILGLQLAGIPFVAMLGYAASIVVALAVLLAVTLLPALLGFAGHKVQRRERACDRARGCRHMQARSARRAERAARPGRWLRWAEHVAHHPWRYLLTSTVVLLALATPMLDLRLGQADAGTKPESQTARRAYDLLAGAFGEGFNGPLRLVADLDGATRAQDLDAVVQEVRATPGVVAVSPPTLNDAGDTAVFTVIPSSKPQAEETSDLVHALRDDVLPPATAGTGIEVLVGGPTASFIDQSEKIAGRLPLFIGGVILVSFALLMMVFRSVLVPLKAALLNLLSIGAAYGVVVAVFQWGWGRSLVGLDEAVPIAAFVPMMMFAILFGLSMDYEVFILSRVREEYGRGRGNLASVVQGLSATAKVVTSAALIMIAVFTSFVLNDDPVVKMMGVGLATAVLVDATLVRMVLLPATMTLLGDANWWLPRWLDRILPHVDVEGVDRVHEIEAGEKAEGVERGVGAGAGPVS